MSEVDTEHDRDQRALMEMAIQAQRDGRYVCLYVYYYVCIYIDTGRDIGTNPGTAGRCVV